MPPRPAPSRIAQALDYLDKLKSGVGDFVGGVGSNLADRIGTAGGLAYEALTSDPNIGRMTTAEFSEAAANRAPTPRLDQTARDLGTIGRAIVTQPVQTGKAIVQGEIARARGALDSPQAAGEYAGSFIDPMRIAAALRHRAPIAELDVYHGTPHTYAPTESNPLGEFDASKIGTGEGAQAYGHGIYLAETPEVARSYTAAGGSRTGVPQNYAADVVGMMGGGEKAIKHLKSILPPKGEKTFSGESREFIEQTLRDVESGAYKIKQGSLYKADLPDEMIDRMLDWDKPVSEQSAAVRDALMPLVTAAMSKRGTPKYALDYSANRAMGGDIVKDLLVGNGVTRADVSRLLKDAGIPGIKYLDAGSRGQGGSGTRNFVVFPGEEKKVKILERK